MTMHGYRQPASQCAGGILTAVLVAMHLTLPAPAAAARQVPGAAADSLSLAPSNQLIAVRPGAVIERELILTNGTNDPQVVDLSTSRVVEGASPEDTRILHGDASGAASWVELQERRVVVPAGSRRRIAMRIRIPPAAGPGSAATAHLRGRQPFAVSATAGLAAAEESRGYVMRLTTLFVLDFGGAPRGVLANVRTSGRLTSGSSEPHVLLRFRNVGAGPLRGRGVVYARPVLGSGRIRRYPISTFVVPQEQSTTLQVRLHDLPPVAIMHITAEVRSSGGTQQRALGLIIRAPNWLLFLLAAVVAAVVAQVFRMIATWRSKRRQDGSDQPSFL